MSLKDSIRRIRARKQGNADDIKAYIGQTIEVRTEELFNELADELRTMGIQEVKKIVSTIKKGDKGEPGRSIVGPQGKQGKSIIGPRGKPGINGIGEKGDRGEPGKDGREIKKSELLNKINDIENGINISTIKGLNTFLKNLQRAIREKNTSGGKMNHGGGMTLSAGSNVTLTRNTNGTWTIAATGGSGANVATEVLTATQSGTDITLDLTALANTFSSILFVTKNGQILLPNGSAAFSGSSWSRVGNTITVYNADANESYQVQYTYA